MEEQVKLWSGVMEFIKVVLGMAVCLVGVLCIWTVMGAVAVAVVAAVLGVLF